MARLINLKLLADFFNKIGQTATWRQVRARSAVPPIPDIHCSSSQRPYKRLAGNGRLLILI